MMRENASMTEVCWVRGKGRLLGDRDIPVEEGGAMVGGTGARLGVGGQVMGMGMGKLPEVWLMAEAVEAAGTSGVTSTSGGGQQCEG